MQGSSVQNLSQIRPFSKSPACLTDRHGDIHTHRHSQILAQVKLRTKHMSKQDSNSSFVGCFPQGKMTNAIIIKNSKQNKLINWLTLNGVLIY